MYNASLRLLDMDHDGIEHQALEIITGQLRQVIASMTIEQINRDRERFENTIRSHVGKELEKVGLVLINVNITISLNISVIITITSISTLKST